MESKSQPGHKIDTSVTQDELEHFTMATMRLWSLDVNRFKPGEDYNINLQNAKQMYVKSDVAKDPLFLNVNEPKLQSTPTFRTFFALLDNYVHETNVAEVVTDEEVKENWAFIDAIFDTPCMQYCYHYLVAKDRIHGGIDEFKKHVYDLWFSLYRRSKTAQHLDSSAFEHVFVGEFGNGKVSGFHNWVQFYLEEKKGRVDYQGFVFPKKKNYTEVVLDDNAQLIDVQFTWDVSAKAMDKKKVMSSIFVGTSPEFEIALFTLCFLIDDNEDHHCEVGTVGHVYSVNVKCYKNTNDGVTTIATSYPQSMENVLT